jgi:endonuclease III
LKNESQYVKRFTALLRKAIANCPEIESLKRDPVNQLIVGFLEWNATSRQASIAHHKIAEAMVDHNDLRVSHVYEIVAIIGDRYPAVEERVTRLRESLQELYRREHAMSLDSLTTKAKKQARAYFDSLPGMVPYAAAQVSLLCFGAHAVPVDDHLLDHLKEQGAVPEDATVQEAEAFLERQIKSGEAVTSHLALKHFSDHRKPTVSKHPTTKKTTRKKATTARVAKKK